jgi:GDP/UDP-N,N'-diacetylbacillosamine 2-epimerase (hydrolysing)
VTRICVITGTRADYGLLRWVIRDLVEAPDVELQVLATGTHLSPEFGLTEREILNDKVRIDERVEMLVSADTPTGIAKSIGLGVIGFADAFARLEPGAILVLGDRFEIAAAALAATPARIPIAHVHGGERTEGLIDEAFRHAVTKMSHLHFVATEEYRRRVIQLGEAPDRVFFTGAPGLDGFKRIDLPDRSALCDDLALRQESPLAVLTYHPVTLSSAEPTDELEPILAALSRFEGTVIATYPNADTQGRQVIARLKQEAEARDGSFRLVASLGQARYLALLREAEFVIGNSSSGLIEAPSARTPTINVGDRQAGRVRGETVVDVAADPEAISAAIAAVREPAFRDIVNKATNPYGDGDASRRIVRILCETDFGNLARKVFHDLPFTVDEARTR